MIGEKREYTLIYEEKQDVKWSQIDNKGRQRNRSVIVMVQVWLSDDSDAAILEHTIENALDIGPDEWPAAIKDAHQDLIVELLTCNSAAEAVRAGIAMIDKLVTYIPECFDPLFTRYR